MTSTINAPKGSLIRDQTMENRTNHLKIHHLYLLNKEDVQSEVNTIADYAPIKISENEEYYQIEFFAAGLQRSNFNVKLKGQQLKISCSSNALNVLNLSLAFHFQQQIGTGSIEKVINLEKAIIHNRVFASYENDTLTVILKIQQNGEEYEHQILVS